MPDSELKNCKEAGLFLLAVDRGVSFLLISRLIFFRSCSCLWFSRLPVAYFGGLYGLVWFSLFDFMTSFPFPLMFMSMSMLILMLMVTFMLDVVALRFVFVHY